MSRVLIVDDDPGSRSLLARLLSRDLRVQVAEAANGLEALNSLASEAFSLVLLDARMPLFDGIETLQVIRQTPHLKDLPVCMMTVERQEPLVQRAIQLGVSDFILKPLNAKTVLERIGRLLSGADTFGGPTRRLAFEARTRVMIVDPVTEFRTFFVNHVAPRCRVTQCTSGIDALQHCLRYFPDAVLIADNIGLLARDVLVKKLRAIDAGGRTLVVAIVDDGAERLRIPDGCDSSIVRSFDPRAFWADFMRAVGLEDLTLHEDSPIVRDVVSAVQAQCKAMLAIDVCASSVSTDDHRRDWCCARLDVSALDLRIVIETGMPVAALRDALGHARGTASPYVVSDNDISDAVTTLTQIAGSGLGVALAARGMSPKLSPVTVTIAERTASADGDDGQAFATSLVTADGEVLGRLTLRQQE